MSRIEHSDFLCLYSLGATIGKGQFGTVRVAKKTADGNKNTQYAFKLSTTICPITQQPKGLLTEVTLLNKLNHRSIVKLYHHFILEQKISNTEKKVEVGLIMELGFFSLEKYIQKQQKKYQSVSLQQLQKFIKDCLDMLQYMYSKRITHRDIKPANLIVTDLQCFNFRLIDFGLGRDYRYEAMKREFVGTFHYASPQVKQIYNDGVRGVSSNNKVDYFKNDIYSMGITILQFATLKLPSDYESTRKLFDQFISIFGSECRLLSLLKMMIEPDEIYRPNAQQLFNFNQNIFMKSLNSSWNSQQKKVKMIDSVESKDIQPSQSESLTQFAQTQLKSLIKLQDSDLDGMSSKQNGQLSCKPEIIQFNFSQAVLCIKIVDELVLLGVENGGLGVIYENLPFIFIAQMQQNEVVQSKKGISCICINDNDGEIWTGSFNSKLMIWKKRQIIKQITHYISQNQNIFVAKPHRFPVTIFTDAFLEGPKVPNLEHGISTLTFIQDCLAVGYNRGYIHILNGPESLYTCKLHDGPISEIKHQQNRIYTIGFDGAIKRVNLSSLTVDRIFRAAQPSTFIHIELYRKYIKAFTMENKMVIIDYEFSLIDEAESDCSGDIVAIRQYKGKRLILTQFGELIHNCKLLADLRDGKGLSCMSTEADWIFVGTLRGKFYIMQTF